MTIPRRRWSYSLRTLFASMTLVVATLRRLPTIGEQWRRERLRDHKKYMRELDEMAGRTCDDPAKASPPRRGLFRFSLRTLFVVVTLVGCWLGWNLHLIQQRRDTIEWIEGRQAGKPPMTTAGITRNPYLSAKVKLSSIRRLLGDRDYSGGIVVWHDEFDRTELDRISRTFPEAEIWFGQ